MIVLHREVQQPESLVGARTERGDDAGEHVDTAQGRQPLHSTPGEVHGVPLAVLGSAGVRDLRTQCEAFATCADASTAPPAGPRQGWLERDRASHLETA